MLRLPAVSGQFYPADPRELTRLIRKFTVTQPGTGKATVSGCLVPHAGYIYSGGIAGAVFSRIIFPRRVVVLGVRHSQMGEDLAILSEGAWRTPLGDVPVDEALAQTVKAACPGLREDSVAHSREHSLEVELPFLQVLDPDFSFVPVAVGTVRFDDLQALGTGLARVLKESREEILILASSDMNHYESDEITRLKDAKAIKRMKEVDASGLYAVCRKEKISMCGLGPAVTMLTAMGELGVKSGELVGYATSGDVNGDRSSVVGYAGMIFA
ncbi:MAG TPA: AmmeMemoRadiSam system protein B [Candidatus Sulfotelmatobacter sp.]|jgi:AmmeMemoRadiSam system protein B|nr:AmmeMemoRadiSam system protein B [Candidatus Sulfotelmatobacter sp.]